MNGFFHWFNNRNIWFRLVMGIWAMLIILWSGMIYWAYLEQKSNAVEQAHDFARSVHQMTMASLTGMMITGTVGERAVYLDQVKSTDNIKSLEVIRGEKVKKQFGEGIPLHRSLTEDETAALSNGQDVYHVDEASGMLIAVIPAIAKQNYLGKNCLTCHMVKEGDVLGVVSMKISLEKVTDQARGFMITLGLVAVLLSIPFLAFVYWFIGRSVTRPLNEVIEVFDAIGHGNYDNQIVVTHEDEIGKVKHDLADMQSKLKKDVGEAKRAANEMLRIKIALDNVSTGVMIADAGRNIIYMNKSVQQILQGAESEIRKVLPEFKVDQLMGKNIDIFHKNPSVQANLLASLKAPHTAALQLGSRHMTVTANPVLNSEGERLGSVAEWRDRTAEVEVEEEVHALVEAALMGDFSQRLALDGKQGFFLRLAEGLNKLSETTLSGLEDVASVLRAISQGDLTQKISADYQGVFGELKEDTNTTVDRLQEVLGRIRDAAEAINTAAQEIAAGNQDLSGRTEEQASSLEQTSSSMEMLNETVQKNAGDAEQANSLAKTSNEMAARGGDLVQQVVVTMENIEASSLKIHDIISVIDSIAFQTNILALNASVEAARAGEQGRGFAVVATEVRNLAQRSAGAAKEIKELISDSGAKINEGATLVRQTGDTMGDVLGSFQQVARLVTGISTASREQSISIQQVALAVSQMDETTQQNAALVEEAAAAAESLEEQARALAEAVRMFKLSSGGTLPSTVKPMALPSPLGAEALDDMDDPDGWVQIN